METEMIVNVLALVIYSFLVVYPVLFRKKEKVDSESYSRGKGNYSILIIGIAMTVTMVGPADALALSQNGLKYGAIWGLLPIGAALAQFVTSILFAEKIKTQFPAIKSIGDIYLSCSKSSRALIGFIAFIQAIAFSGVLILAGGQILETFLQIDKVFGMVITSLVVGVYTSYNGFVGVIQTDRLQGFFMGGMLLLLLVVSVIIFINLDGNAQQTILIKDAFYKDYDWHLVSTLFLGYFLGEIMLPPYCIRMSVSKSGMAAKRSFRLASILLIFWYVAVAFSGSVGEFVPKSTGGDSQNLILVDVLRAVISNNALSLIIGSFCLLTFISLIHSTFDTFLNNGAVSLSRDVIGNLFKLNEDQELWISKQTTLTIAVFGLVIAIWKNDLIDILFIGYTMWVPTALPSLIWILFHPSKRLNPGIFWIGLTAGVVAWGAFEYLFPKIIPAILAGLVANYLTISLLQQTKYSKDINDVPASKRVK